MSALTCLFALAFQPDPSIDLTASLDPEHQKMTVKCELSVAAPKDGVVEFQLGKQFSTPTVECGGLQVEVKRIREQDREVVYSVPVSPGNVHLSFDYSSIETKGFVFYLSPEECYAGGYNTLWFPVVGESRHMKGRLTFVTPQAFLVKASGRETGSAVQDGQRKTVFDMEDPLVPTFAAGPFVVTRVPGRVPVTTYFLKERENSRAFANGCAEALRVLEREFGPYPFPDFSIIETTKPRDDNLGFSGASFEGFMFGDSPAMDAGFHPAYFGHEMGHQWWGNLVGLSGGTGDYVFNEGLAQYGSLQVVREMDGTKIDRRYRMDGYPLYSDLQCSHGAGVLRVMGRDRPLSDTPAEFSNYQHALANSKGFLVWETLAHRMGRANFSRALKEVAASHRFGLLTWADVWLSLQAKTKSDLKTFRQEWFERAGAPVAWVDWKQDGDKLLVTLCQKEPTYHLDMPMVIQFKDGSQKVVRAEWSATTRTLTVPLRKPVIRVVLDPDHETFHSTPELEAELQANKLFWTFDVEERYEGKTTLDKSALLKGLDSIVQPDSHGSEFLLRFTLSGLLRREKNYAEAERELLQALNCAARTPDFLPHVYLRLAANAKDLGRSEEVRKWLDKLVVAESVLDYQTDAYVQARSRFPDFTFPELTNSPMRK